VLALLLAHGPTVLAPFKGAAVDVTPIPKIVETCEVLPRSQPDLDALLSSTDVATPSATTDGQTLPVGTPVDDPTAALMEQTVQLWLACQNAGEPLRAWSLFSDGYLYRLLSRQGGLTAGGYDALATPEPATDGVAVLQAMRGQRMLADGRYGATVTITYPSVPMPKTFFFYFLRGEDRLLIDGILGEISFSVP